MVARRVAIVVVVAAMAHGCFPNVDVPAGAQISCATDAHCPAGFVCRAKIGLCVSSEERDLGAPSVEDIALSSAAVGRGGEVTVSFEIGRKLFAPPRVELAFEAGRELFKLREGAGSRYLYAYTPTGLEAEGPVQVLLSVVDAFGNEATDVALGALTFDFTPPQVSEVAADRGIVKADAEVSVTFRASEPLAEAPAVTLASGGEWQYDGEPEPLSYRYTYLPTGSEREGQASLRVAVVDEAGNDRTLTFSDVLRFDFTPPEVALATVTYVADPLNPLQAVTKAADDTQILVTVAASEPLSEEPADLPVLTASNGGELLVFETMSHDGGGATFRAYPMGLGDGVYVPTLEWTDLAGNRGESALFEAPPIDVKTSAPLLEVDQEEVVYVRSPWGNAAPEVVGGSTLPAGPYFALEAEGSSGSLPAATFTSADGAPLVRVRVWASAQQDTLLGTLISDDAGAWPRHPLAPLDLQTVFVSGLDEAGNESLSAVRIEQAEWVATANPPTFGVSPHRVSVVPTAEGSLFGAAPVLEAGSEAAAADGSAELAQAELAWRKKIGSGLVPRVRYGHGMAYDSARGRVVLFGGRNAGDRLGDTWEWDGEAWLDVTPPTGGPSARSAHAMVYDAARGRVVLFGGDDGGYRQDTWEWDGAGWRDVTPAGDGPSGRAAHAMAYDGARRVVLLVGGEDAVAYRQDTWAWDGERWEALVAEAAGPGARAAHAMAFDAARGRMVLFGGDDGLTDLQDTWEWDGSAWVETTPAGDSPPPRQLHALAYDAARGRVLLFGGVGADEHQDTWEYDGSGWEKRTPPAGRPSGRDEHAMVYDGVRGRVLLFGGWDGDDRQDTWEWDGARWDEVTLSDDDPGERWLPAMAYDSARGRVVLFGGWLAGSFLQDTWEWDGRSWQEVTPAGAAPAPRSDHAMTYDSARERVLLFGGLGGGLYRQDTWEWDGVNWIEVTPPGASPSARANAALVYDSARSRAVLFGGGDGVAEGDTWEWDGSGWQDVTPAGGEPSARTFHAMAYDSARSRAVLFGGDDGGGPRQDTWEWDGTSWQEVTPAGEKPSARSFHAMAYDSDRGRVLLFGGSAGAERRQDTWEWDGAQWAPETSSSERPEAREYHAMAYDSGRGEAVLFGGDGPLRPGDTWLRAGAPSRQPAAQLVVSTLPSGIAPAQLRGLQVRAHAGGSYAPFAADSQGATLLGWRTGGEGGGSGAWLPLASNDAGLLDEQPFLPAPPGALLEAERGDARDFLLEREGQLAFQVRPSGDSGVGSQQAQVALDYIEVRLRYSASSP